MSTGHTTSQLGAAGDPMAQPIDTKTALLHAAEELFSERGYAAVGIRDIAARAEANVSSIKYHFGSKRELYLETMRWLLQHTDIKGGWEVFEDLPDTRIAAATALVLYIQGALEQSVSGGRPTHCVRLMLQEALHPGEDFEFIISNFSAPYERLMVELVRRIAPGDTDIFYITSGRSIFAQVLHYFVWKSFLDSSEYGGLGQRAPVKEAADVVAMSTLRGLGCSKEFIEEAMTAARSFSP